MLQTHVHQKQEIVAFPIGEIDFTNSMLLDNVSSLITPYYIYMIIIMILLKTLPVQKKM